MANNFYEILGVSQWATDEELRSAIEHITQDLGEAWDEESMAALQLARKAYATLSDPRARADYDRKLARRSIACPPQARAPGRPQLRRIPPPRESGIPGQVSLPALINRHPVLLLAALLGLLMFLSIQQGNTSRAESRLAATEKAMAAALAEKDEALAQARSELARQQHEIEDKRAELENRRIELESRRIDMEQRSVDADREVALKQIENQAETANRRLGLSAKRVEAETRQTNAITQGLAIEAMQRQFRYDRQVANEGFAIRREQALLNKYREQELNGEDRIRRGNPAFDR